MEQSVSVSVNLRPTPGFCIKSSTLHPSIFKQNATIPIPIGYKVFVNIAWDSNVPSPPQGSEEIIQRAMKGEYVDELNPDGWYVPVIVSEGRQDKDKGMPIFTPDTISVSPTQSWNRTTHNPIYHHRISL